MYYETERLEAIEAVQAFDKDDYEAFKMWKVLEKKQEDLSSKLRRMNVIG